MTARRLLLVTLIALASCGSERSAPAVVKSRDLELSAAVAPAVLRVGRNELWLELRDAAGQPLDGARVEARVFMHAMGAMPAMGGPAGVEALGGGRYRAAFDLAMGGTWLVEVKARAPGGAALEAEGSLTVGNPGLRLEGSTSTEREAAGGDREDRPLFSFDPERLRQVGVRSEPAVRAPMTSALRAVGRVTWDERALRDVTLRVGGFAGEVAAGATGQRVERGQVLFQLYGPELYAAQQEYLQALRSRAAARGTSAPGRADALVRAAERRLALWEIDPADVARIARSGQPLEYLPIRAPASGYLVEKDVVAGASIAAGQRVYRIAPLERVWIEAELYESELDRVAVGDPAEVTLPYHPGRRFEARVAYLQPALDGERRTARVRLELANPDGALRPDMYATVFLKKDLGERLTVPDTAVLRAGDRSFVFLDLGGGRLRPQPVAIGASADGRVEILSGLEAGQPVVVAGTFLVAGESRLRAALESW